MKVDPGFDVFVDQPNELRICIKRSRAVRKFVWHLGIAGVVCVVLIASVRSANVEWSWGVGLSAVTMLALLVGSIGTFVRLAHGTLEDDVFVFDRQTGFITHN